MFKSDLCHVLSLQLIPNDELRQTLLAHDAEVKVLKPLSHQQEIKDMISRSAKRYALESDVQYILLHSCIGVPCSMFQFNT